MMINQSLIAPLRCLPISSSSRFSPPSFLLLVIHLVLVIYRLVSRLAPVVLLLRLVSLRRRFYPCRYRIRHLLSPSAHLSVHHPIVAVFHCLPYCPIGLIAFSSPAALSILSSPSPLPDGKIELTQTAHSFRHRHQSNRIPRREATGTRARRHEMSKTRPQMTSRRHPHGHETQRTNEMRTEENETKEHYPTPRTAETIRRAKRENTDCLTRRADETRTRNEKR